MGLQSAERDGTVGKALDVLEQVASHGAPVRFGALLEGSAYPKATLYRLVQTLTSQGMLAFDPDRGTYSLGVRLVRLAHAAWNQSSLAPIARPHLDVLSAAVGETVHLAQLDHAQVLYVDKRNARDPLPMYSEAGKIGPAYCTGVGKAMLAYLSEDELTPILAQQSYHRFTDHTLVSADEVRAELAHIRARGYGFDREEHEPGIICIAMAVRSETGRVLGAVSVTSSTARTSLEGLEAHAPELRSAVDQIARDLRDWRFPDRQQG